MNPNGPQPSNPDGPAPYGGSAGIWGAALQAGSHIYDTYQRHRDVKSEQAARKQEAELAYQRSQEMWHLQNAYNTPAQQMARFGAAGLNSQLIYSQGNSGQASSPPEYHPPQINMAGMHPPFGGAVQSLLPTLMDVGSWMQNMRLQETEIKSKETGMDKTNQMIEFLRARNPKDLAKLDNQLSIFPYQSAASRNLAERGNLQITEMLEMLRYNWGDERTGLEFGEFAYKEAGRGKRAIDLQKLKAETRLKSAQADWFEPQTIMRMVMSALTGVTGLGRLIPRTAGKAGKAPFKQPWTPPKINTGRRRGFKR